MPVLVPEARDELYDSLQQLLKARRGAELEATRTKLEGLGDSLRETIKSRIRPKLRPLKILDLPDELLMRIFSYGRRSFFDEDEPGVLFSDPYGTPPKPFKTSKTCV